MRVIAFLLGGGSRRRKLTSGGIDNGALPMRDLHSDELENPLPDPESANAGSKKSGTDVDCVNSTTLLRAVRPVGDNIFGV